MLADIFNALENFDVNLFRLINSGHHPVLDEIMKIVSLKYVWIPLYVLLAFMSYKIWGLKGMLVIIVTAALCVTLTDQTSVHALKNVVMRLRPCHNADFGHAVHLVDGKCGGQYGFVSSHAANTMGIAVFISRMLGYKFKTLLPLLVLWSLLIGYSRIYLGAHYPADVIGGYILGIVIGFVMSSMLLWLSKKYGSKVWLQRKHESLI